MGTIIRSGILLIIGLSVILFTLHLYRPEASYQDQLAVLMYHHIDDLAASSSTITTKLFRDQLSLLKAKDYKFINLQQMKDFLGGAAIPDKAVLITFDDGYESFYTQAYPILKELNIPAVNFIITTSLENPQQDVPPKLSREQIQTMLSNSTLIEVQCHTDSLHNKNVQGKAMLVGQLAADGTPESNEQTNQRIIADTLTCINKLKPLSPVAVDTLAYPFGIYNKAAIKSVQQAGIQYAFTILTRMNTRQADPMQLPRINAGSPNISPEDLVRTIQRSIVAVRN